MKKYIISIILLSGVLSLSAQTHKKVVKKKPVAKKTITKQKVEEDESESNLTAAAAGKFAKDFANKMYSSINFEEKKTSFSVSINKWKPFKLVKDDNTVKMLYMVDITVTWQSGNSGWPTNWREVTYKGNMVFDEFGCEPSFLIKTKKEPSSAGLAALVVKSSPVAEFSADQKQGFGRMDSWCEGTNYVWSPDGCLE